MANWTACDFLLFAVTVGLCCNGALAGSSRWAVTWRDNIGGSLAAVLCEARAQEVRQLLITEEEGCKAFEKHSKLSVC